MKIYELYQNLLSIYGYQNWWPLLTDNKFEEVAIGAVLTQNTSWNNVEKALYNLLKEDLISFEKIKNIDIEKLKALIKPAGFYNQKAEVLKRLANIDKADITREKLLMIKGIGKETADTILLYGLDKPYFVVDKYTKRFFYRFGIIDDENIEYDDLRILIERNIPEDVEIYKEFHALIVFHCKNFCKKLPLCGSCQLKNKCQFLI
ncbi:endonuclease III domain-containing protein [Venenivibrio stagnispumantis]|uniref:DNA-3-methyladenine glycosylase III n=1 Tax=Venenivibrio stagnispumantis TaxID=407998 RepID=A0AA46AEI4_9AQUI|nr:endonuclease [Venenivibrio stagnispumantis]MCW4572871.1 endonuclease [Venenivibrio stagnispumantis]SMP13022.1 DNA-3-methyladenine glycosylase III [Venenivibrio stagnispumantis]